jgi:hypothetical protein
MEIQEREGFLPELKYLLSPVLCFLPEIKYLLSPVFCFLPELKYLLSNKVQEREDTLSQVKTKYRRKKILYLR